MLYRKIEFDPDVDDGFAENVQFVGVYVLNWHERPAQPEVAFVEANDPSVEAAQATQDALQALFDACALADAHEELSEYVDGLLLDAAMDALRQGQSKGMEKYG